MQTPNQRINLDAAWPRKCARQAIQSEPLSDRLCMSSECVVEDTVSQAAHTLARGIPCDFGVFIVESALACALLLDVQGQGQGL